MLTQIHEWHDWESGKGKKLRNRFKIEMTLLKKQLKNMFEIGIFLGKLKCKIYFSCEKTRKYELQYIIRQIYVYLES